VLGAFYIKTIAKSDSGHGSYRWDGPYYLYVGCYTGGSGALTTYDGASSSIELKVGFATTADAFVFNMAYTDSNHN